jgi:hypothetical protein
VVLANFHVTWASSPLWYLGLPLSISCLWRVEFQFLEDKMAVSCQFTWV